jgi:hypothetical protein
LTKILPLISVEMTEARGKNRPPETSYIATSVVLHPMSTTATFEGGKVGSSRPYANRVADESLIMHFNLTPLKVHYEERRDIKQWNKFSVISKWNLLQTGKSFAMCLSEFLFFGKSLMQKCKMQWSRMDPMQSLEKIISRENK